MIFKNRFVTIAVPMIRVLTLCLLLAPITAEAASKKSVIVCFPGKNVSAPEETMKWMQAGLPVDFNLLVLAVNYGTDGVHPDIQSMQHQVEDSLKSLESGFDPSRVYLAGSSAGAELAVALAADRPGFYKQTILLCGAKLKWVRDVRGVKGQKFIFVHGAKDRSVTQADVRKTLKELRQNGAEVAVQVLEDADHYLPLNAYRIAAEHLAID